MYTSRDIAAVAACSALWGILNTLISPIFWQLTRMPFLCDLLAFMALILVVWWTRKFGAASLTGVVVAAMTLTIQPTAFHILAFIAASIVFDIAVKALGYERLFASPVGGSLILIILSVLSAGIAGAIIGPLFMGLGALQAILTFSGLHAFGGLIGGIIGVVVVRALTARRIKSAWILQHPWRDERWSTSRL